MKEATPVPAATGLALVSNGEAEFRMQYDRSTAGRRLRPADQEILRLAAWEELPHDQISRLLGCSVAAVDQRLHRAKKRLAKEFHKTHLPGSPRTEEGHRR
jgi:RNA polymerase sigma-70 factor (ECF subfamily)